jgi:hypothetical protein
MTPKQRKRMVEKRGDGIKKERKRMIAYLTEQGVAKPSKFTAERMRKKYWKMKKEDQERYDKMPNRFAMTKTERNRAKRRRQKLRVA